VPVTIYEHSQFNDEWPNREPSYAPLIEMESKYGDSFVRAPIDVPVLIGDPNRATGSEEQHESGSVVRTLELETPKGKLRAVSRRDPGLMTYWQIEPLIKSDEDIERILSLPDPPMEVNAAGLRELEARVGETGILHFSLGDALGHVVGLFDFEDFVLRCYSDDGPIRALLDKAQEQVLRSIAAIGSVVKDASIRLWGPEYCGAPLMNPAIYFPRYVVERDRVAAQAIHATGNLCVIHCHGRLRDLLDMIADIGADALEPIETLPIATADVTVAEVKARLGGFVCLMGTVQAVTLETGTPEQVRRQVREALAAGAPGGRFVVLPTAAPFMVPLEPRLLANIEAMYAAVHEYGQY